MQRNNVLRDLMGTYNNTYVRIKKNVFMYKLRNVINYYNVRWQTCVCPLVPRIYR